MMIENTLDDEKRKSAVIVLGCGPDEGDHRYKAESVADVYKTVNPDFVLLIGSTFEEIRNMENLIENVGEEKNVYIGLKVRHLQGSADDLENLDKAVSHLKMDGVSEISVIASYNQYDRVAQYLKGKFENRESKGTKVGVFTPIPYSVGDL